MHGPKYEILHKYFYNIIYSISQLLSFGSLPHREMQQRWPEDAGYSCSAEFKTQSEFETLEALTIFQLVYKLIMPFDFRLP